VENWDRFVQDKAQQFVDLGSFYNYMLLQEFWHNDSEVIVGEFPEDQDP